MNFPDQLNIFNNRYSAPIIISDLINRIDTTPDITKLRHYKYIPLAVYDDLRGSFDFAPKLFEKSEFLGDGFSSTDSYKMYTDANGQAIAFTRNQGFNNAHGWYKIKVNIWACPPEVILALDKYYYNNNRMFRKKCNYFLTEQVVKTTIKGKVLHPSLSCYTYLGLPEYYKNRELKAKNALTTYSVESPLNSKSYYSHMKGLY